MVHPDGFRPSSLLLDKDTPRHIWLLTCLERSRHLAIIMNLVHENVFLINTAGKHTFFENISSRYPPAVIAFNHILRLLYDRVEMILILKLVGVELLSLEFGLQDHAEELYFGVGEVGVPKIYY